MKEEAIKKKILQRFQNTIGGAGKLNPREKILLKIAAEVVSDSKKSEKKYGLYNDEPVIRTVSGRWVNIFDPKPNMFCIEDIAHSLSMQCRFGAHLKHFYSVAQHSLHCSYMLNGTKHALAGLLHDASEAYLLDLPRPIKLRMPEYRKIEDNLMAVIASKFGFEYPLHPEVKKADRDALEGEWQSYMIEGAKFLQQPIDVTLIFLEHYRSLI